MTIYIPSVRQSSNYWCVYHVLYNGTPIFMGVNTIEKASSLDQARENSEFRRMVEQHDFAVTIEILETHPTKESAVNAGHSIFKSGVMPICNLKGTSNKTDTRLIKCSNGKTYTSQSQAARELGISQSNLSKVLRGQAQSIGGKRFWYADEEYKVAHQHQPPIQSITSAAPPDVYLQYVDYCNANGVTPDSREVFNHLHGITQ